MMSNQEDVTNPPNRTECCETQSSAHQQWSERAGLTGARAEAAAALPLSEGVQGLPDEQPVTVIRDSLYDRIPLGAAERALIGSVPFLRLQDVKQLGFVYRIWPGATHTRYEHSLGVYYLALRALRSLLARKQDGGLVDVSMTGLARDAGAGAAARHRPLSLLTRD